MKTTAPQKLKFLKLKRRLGLTHWQTVGLLESLWLFTQGNAPAGDIGRHSDEDIAAAIEWQGSAAELIETLVEYGWLDRCPANRLLVHGWEEHAPTYIKGSKARYGDGFAKHGAKYAAKHHAKDHAKHTANEPPNDAEHTARDGPTNPNLTKPNQTIESPPGAGDARPRKKKTSEAYPRNPLFDAIAEVTGTDPSVKSVGSLLGSKSFELASASPPYTPEEVREFGRRFHEFCPHAARDNRPRPTVPELVKWIGLLRAGPATANGTPDRGFQPPVFLPNAAPMFSAEPEGQP